MLLAVQGLEKSERCCPVQREHVSGRRHEPESGFAPSHDILGCCRFDGHRVRPEGQGQRGCARHAQCRPPPGSSCRALCDEGQDGRDGGIAGLLCRRASWVRQPIMTRWGPGYASCEANWLAQPEAHAPATSSASVPLEASWRSRSIWRVAPLRLSNRSQLSPAAQKVSE